MCRSKGDSSNKYMYMYPFQNCSSIYGFLKRFKLLDFKTGLQREIYMYTVATTVRGDGKR